MVLESFMTDEIYIKSPSGETVGPVNASVQGNNVIINDITLVIEEGSKIIRPLPNGRAESHTVLQVDFHKDPFGGALSHYEIKTRKDSSLVSIPSTTNINISNSQGIQIGDGNTQNIITSIETLISEINTADVDSEQKSEAKQRLKDFLSHPLTSALLGAGTNILINLLQ